MALREDLYAAQAENAHLASAIDDAVELLESLGDDDELEDTLLKALNRLRAALAE